MHDATSTSTPDHRITPLRRRWRLPRYQPRPDTIAAGLIAATFIDFTDRAIHLIDQGRPFSSLVFLLSAFVFYTVGIWRLSQAATAYYEASPWIRRGHHQHRYSRKARDEFYDTFYHQHHWAFPLHKYIFRPSHHRR